MKGALSSEGETEGKRFRMELSAKEYVLCDFSMYAVDSEEAISESADQYSENEDPDSMTGEEILARIFRETERSPASEEYSVNCDANIRSDTNGRTIIEYRESIDGETEQTTQISFDPQMPGLVTIYKSGAVATVMTLETGRRHSCIYRTPFMDFEMRIRTLRAENGITEDGGTLRLDYILEIKGAAAHRTIMEITLREND